MNPDEIPLEVKNGLLIPLFLRSVWWTRDVEYINKKLSASMQMYNHPSTLPDVYRNMLVPHTDDMIKKYLPIKSDFLAFRDFLIEEMKEKDLVKSIDMKYFFNDAGMIIEDEVTPYDILANFTKKISENEYMNKLPEIITNELNIFVKTYTHPIIKVISELWQRLEQKPNIKSLKEPFTNTRLPDFFPVEGEEDTENKKFISHMRFIVRTIGRLRGYSDSSVWFNFHSFGVFSLHLGIGDSSGWLNYVSHMLILTEDFQILHKGCIYIPASVTNEKLTPNTVENNSILRITPIFGSASTGYTQSLEAGTFLTNLDNARSLQPPGPLFFSYIDKYGQLINVRHTNTDGEVYDAGNSSSFTSWPDICAPFMVLGMNWNCVGIDARKREKKLRTWNTLNPTEQMMYQLNGLFCSIILREIRLHDILFKILKKEQEVNRKVKRNPIPFKLMIYNKSQSMDCENQTRQIFFYESLMKNLQISDVSLNQNNYSLISRVAPVSFERELTSNSQTITLEVDTYNNISLKTVINFFTQEKEPLKRKQFIREIILRSLQKTNGLMFLMLFLIKGENIEDVDVKDNLLKTIFDDKLDFPRGLSKAVFRKIKEKVKGIIFENSILFEIMRSDSESPMELTKFENDAAFEIDPNDEDMPLEIGSQNPHPLSPIDLKENVTPPKMSIKRKKEFPFRKIEDGEKNLLDMKDRKQIKRIRKDLRDLENVVDGDLLQNKAEDVKTETKPENFTPPNTSFAKKIKKHDPELINKEKDERVQTLIMKAKAMDDTELFKSKNLLNILQDENLFKSEGKILITHIIPLDLKSNDTIENQISFLMRSMLEKLLNKRRLFILCAKIMKIIVGLKYKNINDLISALSTIAEKVDGFTKLLEEFSFIWNTLVNEAEIWENLTTQLAIEEKIGTGNKATLNNFFQVELKKHKREKNNILLTKNDYEVKHQEEYSYTLKQILTDLGNEYYNTAISEALTTNIELIFNKEHIQPLKESVKKAIYYLFQFDSPSKLKGALANILVDEIIDYRELSPDEQVIVMKDVSEPQSTDIHGKDGASSGKRRIRSLTTAQLKEKKRKGTND